MRARNENDGGRSNADKSEDSNGRDANARPTGKRDGTSAAVGCDAIECRSRPTKIGSVRNLRLRPVKADAI